MEYIEYYMLNHIVLQIYIQYIKNKCRIFLGFENNEFHGRYERFLKIMMLSVLKNTRRPVKFWFIKNYLSPQFKVLSRACEMPVFFSPLDSSCQWYGNKENTIHMYHTHWKCIIHIYHVLYQMLQSLKSQEEEGAGFDSTHGPRIWF
jgi:hypothetical protein